MSDRPIAPLRTPADLLRDDRDSRRLARPGVRAEVRRPGSAADLAAGISTVGPGAAGVRLSADVAPGEALEVVLVRADGRPLPPVPAVVRWRRPLGGGLVAAGLDFSRRLGLAELAGLV